MKRANSVRPEPKENTESPQVESPPMYIDKDEQLSPVGAPKPETEVHPQELELPLQSYLEG